MLKAEGRSWMWLSCNETEREKASHARADSINATRTAPVLLSLSKSRMAIRERKSGAE